MQANPLSRAIKGHPIRDGFFGILRKGFECVIERPGGAFIDQFSNWSILLFAPISRKAQMHASPPLASHLLHCCGAAILAPGEGLEC